jgi:hypothetical protein
VPDGEDCEYGTQSYFCNQHFTCVAGEWKKNLINSFFCGTDDACSSVVDGGVCHGPGQVCSNGDASICVCSECGAGPPPPPPPDGGSYANRAWRCFSPGVGCAVDRANVGSACDLPDGSACSYAQNGCCTGVEELCTDGVWIGLATEPCP